MILDTMTQEELLREIKSDYSEVVGRWRNFQAKFRKQYRKGIISMAMGDVCQDTKAQ